MSEMVERVARAICEDRTWPGAWDRANEVERNAWFRDARAAIKAMRNLTLREATIGGHVALKARAGGAAIDYAFGAGLTAMIDAALSPEQEG